MQTHNSLVVYSEQNPSGSHDHSCNCNLIAYVCHPTPIPSRIVSHSTCDDHSAAGQCERPGEVKRSLWLFLKASFSPSSPLPRCTWILGTQLIPVSDLSPPAAWKTDCSFPSLVRSKNASRLSIGLHPILDIPGQVFRTLSPTSYPRDPCKHCHTQALPQGSLQP